MQLVAVMTALLCLEFAQRSDAAVKTVKVTVDILPPAKEHDGAEILPAQPAQAAAQPGGGGSGTAAAGHDAPNAENAAVTLAHELAHAVYNPGSPLHADGRFSFDSAAPVSVNGREVLPRRAAAAEVAKTAEHNSALDSEEAVNHHVHIVAGAPVPLRQPNQCG
eukprot:COSAG05_NODE_3503_length_2024_cov_4.038442_1_plen_164_part_00